MRFDFGVIRSQSHPMPLMLPSTEQFENQVMRGTLIGADVFY